MRREEKKWIRHELNLQCVRTSKPTARTKTQQTLQYRHLPQNLKVMHRDLLSRVDSDLRPHSCQLGWLVSRSTLALAFHPAAALPQHRWLQGHSEVVHMAVLQRQLSALPCASCCVE